MGLRFACAFAGIAMALVPLSAFAQQQSDNQVATKTDWSVFEETDPKECWAVSTFKESVNSQNGRVVEVKRSKTLLMVFFRPGKEVNGQVAFTGGYPFAKGSTVNLNVGGNSFELFTEGEWAWPFNPSDDAKIVTAMKRGAKAVVSGRSGRGTRTKDTFSLLGFTAALDEAEKRCQ